jgi:CheY-like chemotaxis protein
MQRVRVLVVDDEPNARSALSELLREEGYEVATARDGVEALERIATFRPAVVLSDIQMPRVTGARAPIVVLMSAYAPSSEDSRFFIGKPIGIDELYKTIAAASELARAA